MNCPYCGSDDVEIPTVDNGVGAEQCGPAQCWACGAVQLGPGDRNNEELNVTEEEKRVGWFKGPGKEES